MCGENYDDGIGSSDDETIASSTSSNGGNGKDAEDGNSGGFESDSSPNNTLKRKVIRPDKMAISQLLAFDEVIG